MNYVQRCTIFSLIGVEKNDSTHNTYTAAHNTVRCLAGVVQSLGRSVVTRHVTVRKQAQSFRILIYIYIAEIAINIDHRLKRRGGWNKH